MRQVPWLFGFILGAIATPLAASYDGIEANVRVNAKALCAPQWPSDFAMQSTCVDMMVKGWREFQSVSQEFANNQAMQKALLKCIDQWTKGGRTDFMMAGTCARMQKEGWERLKR